MKNMCALIDSDSEHFSEVDRVDVILIVEEILKYQHINVFNILPK